ncbi:MAG: hypothetical protein U1F43_25865 [Myxococcota bacterium]
MDGQVVLVGEAPSGWAYGRHLRAAVACSSRGARLGEVVVPEQPASLALSFPTAVELSAFRGPPRTAMLPLQPLSGRIAIGQVAVYDDADGDATWDEEREALFGVGTSALVFAETDVDGPRIHVPKGFSSMLLAGCQGDDGLIGLLVSEVRIPIAATPRIGDDARAAFIDPLCRRVHLVWCRPADREACLADPELPACEACADGHPVDASSDE